MHLDFHIYGNPKNHECDVCNKMFYTNFCKIQHVMKEHNQGENGKKKCNICQNEVTFLHSLLIRDKHMNFYTSTPPY